MYRKIFCFNFTTFFFKCSNKTFRQQHEGFIQLNISSKQFLLFNGIIIIKLFKFGLYWNYIKHKHLGSESSLILNSGSGNSLENTFITSYKMLILHGNHVGKGRVSINYHNFQKIKLQKIFDNLKIFGRQIDKHTLN